MSKKAAVTTESVRRSLLTSLADVASRLEAGACLGEDGLVWAASLQQRAEALGVAARALAALARVGTDDSPERLATGPLDAPEQA